jgi:restriction system protein
MLHLLKLIDEKNGLYVKDAIEILSDSFSLTEEERNKCVASGSRKIANNVWWARNHLINAGLLSSPRRGYIEITDGGRKVVASQPEKIDKPFLLQFASYRDSYTGTGSARDEITSLTSKCIINTSINPENQETPEESMERIYQNYKKAMLDEIMERIHSCSPHFFEKLVIELMVRMGYGGTLTDVQEAMTKKTSDEGIDGIINEDRLGLGKIYLQAKRWKDTTIGRPEIQRFAGALIGKASKGVFITTSSFTTEAFAYAKTTPNNITIILIDGKRLCELIWENNLALSSSQSYTLKRIDSDYFNE